jgi:NADPH-dependent F420 reductase
MTDTIAILGTGNMGSGLAHNFAAIGRRVALGSRDRARAQSVGEMLQEEYPDTGLTFGDYAEVSAVAKIIVLAVPFSRGAEVLKGLGDTLAGKTVVDITNPFGAVPPDTSGAEVHAGLLPPTATLVAAWKTNFWKLLDPERRGETVQDCFLCGDDEQSKHLVARLITETGLRPVDCGALANARVLDAMVPLMLELNDRYTRDFRSAWKFLP